jgi:nucleotide-binding universal stress UspA family protein
MLQIKTILVPTDFSEGALHALQYAADLARTFGAEIHLLHAVEAPALSPSFEGLGVVAIPQERTLEHSREELDNLAASMPDLRIKTVLRPGHAADQIVHYANHNGMDLVVIATYGRRGLKRLLMGSTTEKVVRRSLCPVLSIHHPEAHGASAAEHKQENPGLERPGVVSPERWTGL